MECGYEVFKEAGDGQEEALDLFHKESTRSGLAGCQLPILNGLEVLKTIRKTSSVPVHVTAFHDRDYKLAAFGELADGYLENPSPCPLEGPYQAIFKSSSLPGSSPMERARSGFESYTASLAGQAISMNAKGVEILNTCSA